MAAGSYGDLAVVLSQASLRSPVDQFLGKLNTEKTYVIKQEKLFKTDVYEPGKWDLAKGYKNALFVVHLGQGGAVEKAARKIMSQGAWDKLNSGRGGIVQLKDPWSTYQMVVVVASRDRNSLASLLQQNAERIRDIFEASSRTRILRRYRYDGIQTELMNTTWQRFGFFLEIPKTFTQNQVEPEGFPGMELLQSGPSRGLTISWLDTPAPADLLDDRVALLAMRQDMGQAMHNEDILPETLIWSLDKFGDRDVIKLEGAWSSNSFAGGGPFWCYFVADPDGSRVYCIDLLVYAPGMDKSDFFRRLSAIASTFSTQRPQP